jgi:tRNA pseudouridine32 synthase/23S rRNA pseudouridine746 synthase
MGWPILGDPVYGHGRREGALPLHLHARSIVIPMQESKPPVRVEAPAPAHMLAAMAACGWVDHGQAHELQNGAEAATLTD